MKIPVKSYLLFKYREVYKITKRKDSAVFETKPTGKFIRKDQMDSLNDELYTVTSVASSQEELWLDVEDADYFEKESQC